MAKKEASKTKQALEKKNTAEIEKAVTFDSMSIEAKDVFKNKLLMLPVPMYVTSLNQCNKIAFLKVALKNSDLHEELINEIMGDLITGAYQNRLEAYSTPLSEDERGSLDTIGKLQRQRQSADRHLLNIIKMIRDIKRPPVQVVVKQAEQVNIAEQINQADKQVNISKDKQSA
jgi:hypothetical protein